MTRPTDWWVLDLDGDPAPGSPSAVRAMARRWHEVAEDAAWAQRRVAQLMSDEAVGRWLGEAGEAFRARSSELPRQLGQCADSYGEAASALSWWADRLEDHQHSADAALARGRVARHELERAEASARAAAEHALSLSVPAFAGTAPALEPSRVHDAQARLASARAAQARADAAVADAEARLDAARRLALDARALRESDGRRTAARIHEAADAGIPERSRWDKLKDWATEAWHVVVKVAQVVVAVLGVVALLLGGPLAWVVLAAALVLLADAVMRYVQGRVSLWEVGVAALGCIPGTKGLLDAAAVASLRTALTSPAALLAMPARVIRIGRGSAEAQVVRRFTSPDPLVGDLANHIERAFPGLIKGVNIKVPTLDGRIRELDIDLGSLNIQVKSQNARGLQAQMHKTVNTTGQRTIAYAPTIKPGAWRDAAIKGYIVARDPDELVIILKELL